MPLTYHPKPGALVVVDFDRAFRMPEMVKSRLCVVVSPAIKARKGLCTVVPLSTTAPHEIMPYHLEFMIPFDVSSHWSQGPVWLKGDMIYSVGFHRCSLVRLGKQGGRRVYQTEALPGDLFRRVRSCVLHGLGLSSLTKHLP